ncbi:MAG: NTP transferase domain-containing protein, partial [Rhodobacterales bacterium]|nr:NTP transferase domain-containing protein [Rhodobacterales bacterium]
MNHLAILILAAGASARMNGRDKLLEPINDTPLLGVIVARATSTGAQV